MLNKALPSVVVPPDGVSPLTMTSTAAPKKEPAKGEARSAAATKPPLKH